MKKILWKNYENHLNPVMWVFIGKLLLSTIRWVPICQGFSNLSVFCHYFMLTKFETSSIRVKNYTSRMIHPSNAEATSVQRTSSSWKPIIPCQVGIHWIALAEYSQMATRVTGFQSFFRFFLHHFLLANLATSSIRVKINYWLSKVFSIEELIWWSACNKVPCKLNLKWILKLFSSVKLMTSKE